jgi:hypothetical protein
VFSGTLSFLSSFFLCLLQTFSSCFYSTYTQIGGKNLDRWENKRQDRVVAVVVKEEEEEAEEEEEDYDEEGK